MAKVRFSVFFCSLTLFLGTAVMVGAATLTFDDLIMGATSYHFDSDGDSIADVIFSTTDPAGFNTLGPGPNMTYIQEPGLEGSVLVNHPTNHDLRVDFLNQAQNSLMFGFALCDSFESTNTWASFEVYNAAGTLIASDFEYGLFTTPDGTNPSSFPEGLIETNFAGIASYATFDFCNDPSGCQRYIIDNLSGTFGSTEVPPANGVIPEPSTLLLFGIGMLPFLRKKK